MITAASSICTVHYSHRAEVSAQYTNEASRYSNAFGAKSAREEERISLFFAAVCSRAASKTDNYTHSLAAEWVR
jgi:hypothetical protein